MAKETFDLKATITVDGATKAKNELSKFEDTTTKSSKSLDTFMAVAKNAALVFGALKFGEMALDLTALAGKFESINNAFEAFVAKAGSMTISLESLRMATRGTVNSTELLMAANNALALGLPINKLNELFDAATVVGNAMGRTTLQAVNDLATGIGRQSRLILDNLGIIVKADEAQKAYADSLGVTVSQLTQAERKTAFMNEAMRALNEHAKTLEGTMSKSSINTQQFSANIDNLKVRFGQLVAQGINPLFELYDALTIKQQRWWESTDEFLMKAVWRHGQSVTEIEGFWDAMEDKFGDNQQGMIDWLEDHGIALDAIAQNYLDWEQISIDAIGGIAQGYTELSTLNEEFWRRKKADDKAAMEEIEAEWSDYYTDLYDSQENWIDKIENTISSHYDTLISDAEEAARREIDLVNDKYDDMLDAERAYLGQIRGDRRTDLEDLELWFLTEKLALNRSLQDRNMSEERYGKELDLLEDKYRDRRAKKNDNYRFDELTEIIRLRNTEGEIAASKAVEIESLEANLRDDLKRINDQKEADMEKFQQNLLDILDTLGTGFKELIDDINGYLDGYTNKIKDLENQTGTSLKGMIGDWNQYGSAVKGALDAQDWANIAKELKAKGLTIQEWAAGGGGVGGDTGGAASSYPSREFQRTGSYIKDGKSVADQTGWYPSKAEASAAWSALARENKDSGTSSTSKQFSRSAEMGFEGWVSQPTTFTVGEGYKPEYVSVKNQNQMSGGGGGININMNFPNVNSLSTDRAEINRIYKPVLRRIMLQLSGER